MRDFCYYVSPRTGIRFVLHIVSDCSLSPSISLVLSLFPKFPFGITRPLLERE